MWKWQERLRKECKYNGKTYNKKEKTDKQLYSELYNYMIKNSDKVVDVVKKALVNISIIQDDADPDGNPKYVFFGSGCGFSRINYDARSKIAKKFLSSENRNRAIAYEVIDSVRAYLIENILDIETKKYLEKVGSPIEAILYQDIDIQATLNSLVADFLREKYGVKKIYVTSRLD